MELVFNEILEEAQFTLTLSHRVLYLVVGVKVFHGLSIIRDVLLLVVFINPLNGKAPTLVEKIR